MSDLRGHLPRILGGIELSSDLHVPRAPGFRRVWYCTNRAIRDSQAIGPARFSNELGEQRAYGLCQVRVNPNRKLGEMDRLSWGLTGFKRLKLIQLAEDYQFTSLELFLKMQQELKKRQNRQSLLFVHGFNVGFVDAIERAAQLAEDLVISGEVFAFSWPSQGKSTDYIADQDRAEKSVSDLIAWEQVVLTAMGTEHGHTIHVVAHSMGTRVLMPGILDLFKISTGSCLIGEVVLAAGDADIDKMDSWLDEAVTRVRRVSIYASATDRALKISQRLHRSKRAGAAPSSDPRWDTVHCDGCGDDWFKHSYIFETRAVLTDIRSALDAMLCEERHLLPSEEPRTWKLVIG